MTRCSSDMIRKITGCRQPGGESFSYLKKPSGNISRTGTKCSPKNMMSVWTLGMNNFFPYLTYSCKFTCGSISQGMLMDRLTKEQRRKNMKAVKNKDTQIEILLRKELWRRNYRYRKNFAQLPGKPDIVLTKYKIAVFCDSEFWHGYDWENRKNDIKSNRDFWIRKIEGNIRRDKEVTEQLKKEGWIVLRFWGNDIKNNLPWCVKTIEETIKELKNK